jgi:hypothetical protein
MIVGFIVETTDVNELGKKAIHDAWKSKSDDDVYDELSKNKTLYGARVAKAL